MKKLTIWAALALLAGCSSAAEEKAVGHSALPLAISDTTTYPYPVDEISFGQEVKSNWDGTLVDLLAADALGMCAFNLSGVADGDSYLEYLETKMTAAECAAAEADGLWTTYPSTGSGSSSERWDDERIRLSA